MSLNKNPTEVTSAGRKLSDLLIGKWTSSCSVRLKKLSQITFNADGSGELVINNYSDKKCSNRINHNIISFHYYLGAKVDLGSGNIATELDIIADVIKEYRNNELKRTKDAKEKDGI